MKNENELDISGLERLIEHILGGGVHGIFLLGTTGEGPSLSIALKYEMVKRSCEIIAQRVPVLVGITDTSFSESVRLAQHAAQCGADAVVLAPPYYFPTGQEELLGESVMFGGHGGVPGGANIKPHLFVDTWKSCPLISLKYF